MRAKLLILALGLIANAVMALEPCRIEVVEKGTGWPVPLVELRTVNQVRFITDNAGVVAFDLPEMMGKETWLGLSGHGYEVKKDGFGFQGVRVTPQPGKTIKVEVDRLNIAKRLGRLTGAGLFAESQKTDKELDWQESGIVGSDSVQNAVHNGKMFWAWGDTMMANYPLGVYDMSSATSEIQPLKSFEPPLKLKLSYFRDDKGKVRGVAKMPGTGPTWVSSYVSLPDKTGKARLVGNYVKIRGHLEAYEAGLCVWNEEKESFDPLKVLWTKSEAQPKQPMMPNGHPSFMKDAQGKEWVYFGDPLPKVRCAATFEAWQDPAAWEVLKPQESLVSATDGKAVKPHTGSIAWNGFRKRWVTVFMEAGGKPSVFGELWYAEADAPTGPWGKAVKVLTHDHYTFYNPRLHPEFTPEGSPILIFEGTYTKEFSDGKEFTPRYDYNQMIYRLDLNDSKLKAAQEK